MSILQIDGIDLERHKAVQLIDTVRAAFADLQNNRVRSAVNRANSQALRNALNTSMKSTITEEVCSELQTRVGHLLD